MIHQKFREALGASLGQQLTPELAARIEQYVFTQEDNSINPDVFGVQQYKDYTIRAERFRDILPEIHQLHVEHWQETEKHRHGLKMNPNYEAMLARERAGEMVQFTLRDSDGQLVGNCRVYINVSLHTQTRYASEDTLFIKPQHRGGFVVMALMKFAENSMRALGVTEMRTNSKMVNKADVLMRRMRYTPVAIEFVKFFEE